MNVISILNHKGGVGKSTISTNLAGYFANIGKSVMIGDFDVQQSSQNWLSQRAPKFPKIKMWEIKNGQLTPPEDNVDYIIIDSPAGIRATSLQKLVSMSDKVIVPLRPGFFDMLSTESFLEEIVEIINSQKKETDLCLVGNMVDLNTKSSEQLVKFVNSCGLPVAAMISHSQVYVHLAAHGLTVFDSRGSVFVKEIKQWVPLLKWLLDK